MTDALSKLKRHAPWFAVPIVGILMFGLGVSLFSAPAPPAAEEEVWTCSMHPQVRRPEPGVCPLCPMDLILLDSDDESPEGSGDDQVVLSERARTLARIRTVPVGRVGGQGTERRLLGRVDYDESTLRTVTAWIGGRIDRLHVRTTGEVIRRGRAVATLYSPEVYSAHQDLLLAKQQQTRLSTSSSETARLASAAAVNSSLTRLRLLGVPPAQLTAMQNAQRPTERIQIRSPFAGTVTERLATEGSYVTTGTPLYKIADLGRVWVLLDAYESDLPNLNVGQVVSLTVEAVPGELFEGRIAFKDPVLSPSTRTSKIRVEVANPDGRLSPGMFAEALVGGAPPGGADPVIQALTIPDSAPLFTGRRSVVYVELPQASGDGRFRYEMREVELGPRVGEVFSVISGLREGERVVVSGAFVLDADLQLQGGRSMMTLDESTEQAGTVELPAAMEAGVVALIESYLVLQRALAADDLPSSIVAANAIESAVQRVNESAAPPAAGQWAQLSPLLESELQGLKGVESLEDARTSFRAVSQSVLTLLRVFGNPTGEPVRLAFCPMAFSNEGAEWVQTSAEIQNPYFGTAMSRCGEVREVVEIGRFLPSEPETP